MDFFQAVKTKDKNLWSQLRDEEDPNVLDSFGQTPLALALKWEDLEFFSFCLENGSDPFFPHRPNGSVFHLLLESNKPEFSEEVLRHLERLKNSPNLLTKDSSGNTIFHYAVQDQWQDLCFYLDPFFQSRPSLLLEKNNLGLTVLVTSFLEGSWESTERLLAIVKRAEIFQNQNSFVFSMLFENSLFLDNEQRNVLHLLAENNNYSVLSQVLKTTSPTTSALNYRDKFGFTALYLAADADATECLELLLRAGADPWGSEMEAGCVPMLLEKNKRKHSLLTWKNFVKSQANQSLEFRKKTEEKILQQPAMPFTSEDLAAMKLLHLLK